MRSVRVKKELFIYSSILCVICFLLFARDIIGVSIPLFAFLGIFTIGFCVLDYNHMIAIAAIMPLLNHGVQTNYIIIIAIGVYILKYRFSLKINRIHFGIFALMLFEFFHLSVEPFSISEYLRYFVQYIFIGLVLGDEQLTEKLDNPRIVVDTFIYMTMYFMCDVLLVTMKYTSFAELFSSGIRFGRLTSDVPTLFDNENMVALFALIAMTFCILMIYKKYSPIRYSVCVVLLLFFGLLTSSKTFLLCLGFLIVYFVVCIGKSDGIKKLGELLLILALAFLLIRNTFIWEEFERVLLRFESADITTGRLGLIAQYNTYLSNHASSIIFGIGLQDISGKTGIRLSPHNAFQEIIICWGIIGLILLLLVIIWLIRKVQAECQYEVEAVYYAPLLVFGLFIQTIQFVSNSAIFGMLIVLFLSIHMSRMKKED